MQLALTLTADGAEEQLPSNKSAAGHTLELFGNFSSPNNFLTEQQNTQYFAGLERQREAKVRRTFASTELSNKSSMLFMKEKQYMKKVIVLLASISLVVVSCESLFPHQVQVKFDSTSFYEQRSLWKESEMMNYHYDLTARGFIGYQGTIFVENGMFKSDISQSTDDRIEGFLDYSTIDEIYATIERSFLKYHNTKQSKGRDVYYTEIVVEYDPINHIPTKIIYKYHSHPNLAVDGTFHYEINAFAKREPSLRTFTSPPKNATL